MFERRQQPRNRVYYGGMVAFNDRNSTIACVVRNFSMIGAKIEFEGAAFVPDRWISKSSARASPVMARMVWRDRDAAGLVFANVRETGDVIPLAWAQKAARDRTGQPETPVAPRSASDPSIRSYEHG